MSIDLKRGKFLEQYENYKARCLIDDHSRDGYYDEDGVRRGGLIAFVRYFWSVLEPETSFTDGWPLWAICEHLEAVTAGKIKRLLINVPPGFMKSMLVDVFWPAWEWGPRNCANLRYVAFSYAATLTMRDNNRFRDLITSDQYQKLYGDRVVVKFGPKAGAERIINLRRGWKFASSVSGVGTGERGDRVILDDPHNVKEAESQTVREETTRWFRESMSNRLNSPETGAIIIIMQRLHADDISGVVLDLGLDYTHLLIPMEFDWDMQTQDGEPKYNQIGWHDPRYDPDPSKCDNELAWPARFSAQNYAQTKIEIGPYATAGQYQQSPNPRGGGLFKREWWKLWQPVDGKFPVFDYVFASVDGAYTTKEQNDPSAMTVWGTFKTDRTDSNDRGIMLITAWRKHLQFSAPQIERLHNEPLLQFKWRTSEQWGLLEWIMYTCLQYKVDKVLIEAKGPGLSAAQELQNRYGIQSFAVQLVDVKGDKLARALAVQPTFSQGLVWAPEKDWAELTITEMEKFPKGKYDDLTDTVTQALRYARDTGLLQTDDELAYVERERVTFRKPMQPLYQV